MVNSSAHIHLEVADNTLTLSGEWVIRHIRSLARQMDALRWHNMTSVVLQATQVTRLDSAGAWQLCRLIRQLQQQGIAYRLEGLTTANRHLYELVAERGQAIHQMLPEPPPRPWLVALGQWGVAKYDQLNRFLSFIGEIVVLLARQVRHLHRSPWQATCKILEETGCAALPIVALMIFLIGVVLAYQLGTQLRTYGADSYIPGLVGIAILREFAPMITSIIIAGRTSTAFTALIGTMKVNEELDALATMGLSPLEKLVLPRLVGLVIVLPLLVVWGDLFGILGGMVMAKSMMNMGYAAFLQRFSTDVSLAQYVLGLIKTPVFALIIAGVGCFQGFQVGGSADSVGKKTTQSAVQSIFLIIIADALFSVLFSAQGL